MEKKVDFRRISEGSEIELVLDKIEHYSGVRLPAEYANRAKIVGGYLQGKLVASYMLITKPGFRSLLFVPDQIKAKHKFFLNNQYDMLEVNGLWISPSLKSPTQQLKVWAHLLLDIFRSKKKYLLLMANAKNANISHIHSLCNPSVLYEGRPELLPGHNSYPTIRVSYVSRWNLFWNLHRYIKEYRSRARRFGYPQRSIPTSNINSIENTTI